jgi:exopolyphosphatase/guanosine-5'-triphosphate,3'-diphosphate pyrophosphatase
MGCWQNLPHRYSDVWQKNILEGVDEMADLPIVNAVIDLGTNTFNLLIAENSGGGTFRVLHEERIAVKMGSGGINKKKLLPEAIERGLNALSLHEINIRKYGVSNLRIIGTSAIRGASNREEFINLVRERFGWEMEVIDGNKEADYIFRGTLHSLPPLEEKYLVVDIGGGSNEFILAEKDQILWKHSFNIGIARVLELFKMSDPPDLPEIAEVEAWFSEHLTPLKEICKIHQPRVMVGCSGAFDTLMDILEEKVPDATFRKSSYFPLDQFYRIHRLLISVNREDRSLIPGVDKNRVEMIIIATIFINFILRELNIRELIHTHFSLKEGVMFEMFNNLSL